MIIKIVSRSNLNRFKIFQLKFEFLVSISKYFIMNFKFIQPSFQEFQLRNINFEKNTFYLYSFLINYLK